MAVTYHRTKKKRYERPGKKIKKKDSGKKEDRRLFINQPANHQEQRFKNPFVSKKMCNECNSLSL
jgi:hypothetical protein